MNKFCQSCGLPMNKDQEKGGTNADGTKNTEYCSYCYKDGEFVGDFKTAKEMQDFCVKKMNEDGSRGRHLRWLARYLVAHPGICRGGYPAGIETTCC